ncbi:MAG: hypothetical protein KDD55_02120 [Bdellovibrionales bacterium]|nr:hypothetical protein [Bdellovibrionales bacterium]
MSERELRWAGRNGQKDELRRRVWSILEETGYGQGPIWNLISNFVDADKAAERLAQTEYWKAAKIIKCNPDIPQIPVRHRALLDGKLLYTPVPELVQDFPFVLLDPKKLQDQGIDLLEAAHIEGALKYGQKVQFTEMMPMDVFVVGSVAVATNGGRTGKGGGFADLELGVFGELNIIPEHAKVVTTVHDVQLVDESEVPLQAHDFPLDGIFTPTQSIEIKSLHPRPKGVCWDAVQADQFKDIPFLETLRGELERQ